MKTSASARRPRKAPAAAPAAPAPLATPPAIPEPEYGFAPPERYDPSDYRWVPVRRRPRHDGWTEEKQRRFIEVLADTGLVGLAAKDVGMSRLSAYRLRRAPYAGAFARAWDIARERAGALIEDIAFERAIEGVEQEIYDGHGGLKASRTIYSDRLLTFLLGALKPERYSREVRQARAWAQRADGAAVEAAPLELANASPRELAPPPGLIEPSLDAALRAMEPVPPAPVEALLDAEELEDALLCAEIADGVLPQSKAEQRPVRTAEELRQAENRARYENGREAADKFERLEALSDKEFEDMCLYLDPTVLKEEPRKRRIAKPV